MNEGTSNIWNKVQAIDVQRKDREKIYDSYLLKYYSYVLFDKYMTVVHYNNYFQWCSSCYGGNHDLLQEDFPN